MLSSRMILPFVLAVSCLGNQGVLGANSSVAPEVASNLPLSISTVAGRTALNFDSVLLADGSDGNSSSGAAGTSDTTAGSNASSSSADSAASGAAGNDPKPVSTASLAADLSALEFRFFAHSFPNETTEQRLDRIERLVFGARRKGSPELRVSRLLLDVPDLTIPSSDSKVAQAPATATQLQPETPVMAPTQSSPEYKYTPYQAPDPTQNNQQNSQASSPETSQLPPGYPAPAPDISNQSDSSEFSQNNVDYPTVDALEDQILGSSAASSRSLPLAQRLSNLETKAFGQSYPSLSLSSRVDQLKQYVAKQNPQQNEEYLSSPYPAVQTDNDSLVAEISAMENEVFGKTYSRDTLISRVNRLNEAVFKGQPAQTFTPLSIQVSKLATALQPKFTANTQVPASSAYGKYKEEKDKDKKKGHTFLHTLGKVLVGVGEAAGAAVGGMAASSMMMGGYGYGYGGYGGFGYGGYPNYGMMPGVMGYGI